MSVTSAYVIYAANLAPITTDDAIFIDQVESQSISPQVTTRLLSADGMVDNTYAYAASVSPRISITTSKLATILAEGTSKIFIQGIKIDSDETHDGAEFFLRKTVEGGTRATGANHRKMTVNEGLLLPRTLTASQEGYATLTFDLVVGWDGTNDPIVVADSASLEGTPSVSELFTCGPVSINGTTLNGVSNVSIDAGLQERAIMADGEPYPTYIYILKREPKIRITTYDMAVLDLIGIEGESQSATDSIIYLRKCDEGGTRVADATAEHISLAIDQGMMTIQSITGQGNEPIGAEILIEPTYDGINEVLVVDASCAIA